MGKSTHFIGQPVYNQVIKLLDKQQIKQISLETPRSEAYVKRLDGWTHLVIMLFRCSQNTLILFGKWRIGNEG